MEVGASPSLQPPSPFLDDTWHVSVGCCPYPAAPIPVTSRWDAYIKYNLDLLRYSSSRQILTFSFMQASAAALASAAARLPALAVNVISSGQSRVSSHFFSFPPVVLNCSSSCSNKSHGSLQCTLSLKRIDGYRPKQSELQTQILLDDVATWITLFSRDLGCGNKERASDTLESSSLAGARSFALPL